MGNQYMDYGPEYTKINTCWKRDEHGKVIIGDWAQPEFRYMADLPWTWTEKVDGTNIRLHRPAKGYDVRVGGRTDNAQLPKGFVNTLQEGGVLDLGKWDQAHDKAGPDTPITVYGEGYGAGIQKGGCYRPDKWLAVFDVRVGDWWLQHDDVAEIADLLGLETVPYVGVFSPRVAWHHVAHDETLSHWPDAPLEGYVGRPLTDLFNRRGQRILMKVKVKDWKDRATRDL